MTIQETKKEKLQSMLNTINGCVENDIVEEKFIAEFIIGYGSTRRTILEDLKVLELAGRIVRNKGLIYSKKVWEAEQILRKADLNPEA